MNNKRLGHLKELLRHDPDDPFLHYGIAMEYVSMEKFGEALEAFDEIFQRFPNYVPNYYQFGKLLFETGSGDRSLSVLKTGIGVAQKAGDRHAASELSALLEVIEDELE